MTIQDIDYDKELPNIYGKDDDPPDQENNPTKLDDVYGINLGNEMMPNN
jgi:hypothetical protein